jgi:probable F420-dependent oxidoreductase
MLRVSYGLPTHKVEPAGEFMTVAAVAELAAAAERAGFDAAYVTEHPFPPRGWLVEGGHHALDPFVTLAVAASATSILRLQTHLFIAAYRNPFLAAKTVASLDVLSGGRVILGVGAGYLREEFEALGVPFEQRNEDTDLALHAMQAAWSGAPVTLAGDRFDAADNVMLPRPVQRPRPPIWIGGNSRRAARRAVELADGWAPFAVKQNWSSTVRTAAITTVDDLAQRLDELAVHAGNQGRTGPFDIVFGAPGLDMSSWRTGWDDDRVISGCAELAALGVTWVTAALPGNTRAEQLAAIDAFGENVLPHLHGLLPATLL